MISIAFKFVQKSRRNVVKITAFWNHSICSVLCSQKITDGFFDAQKCGMCEKSRKLRQTRKHTASAEIYNVREFCEFCEFVIFV